MSQGGGYVVFRTDDTGAPHDAEQPRPLIASTSVSLTPSIHSMTLVMESCIGFY